MSCSDRLRNLLQQQQTPYTTTSKHAYSMKPFQYPPLAKRTACWMSPDGWWPEEGCGYLRGGRNPFFESRVLCFFNTSTEVCCRRCRGLGFTGVCFSISHTHAMYECAYKDIAAPMYTHGALISAVSHWNTGRERLLGPTVVDGHPKVQFFRAVGIGFSTVLSW